MNKQHTDFEFALIPGEDMHAFEQRLTLAHRRYVAALIKGGLLRLLRALRRDENGTVGGGAASLS